jgi:tetratricopeptide (TPR) repeat protein
VKNCAPWLKVCSTLPSNPFPSEYFVDFNNPKGFPSACGKNPLGIDFEKEADMTLKPDQLAEQGKQAFRNKRFDEAAGLFRQAADAYALDRADLMVAEMRNNLSVALLQADKPQESLDAALDTDKVFAAIKDAKRQGMALGNQAAALEALERYDEAVEKYDLAARLFADAGEGDLRSMVMKSSAAIKLKTGKLTDSAFKMIGSLDAKENPSLLERILKFFIRFIK